MKKDNFNAAHFVIATGLALMAGGATYYFFLKGIPFELWLGFSAGCALWAVIEQQRCLR